MRVPVRKSRSKNYHIIGRRARVDNYAPGCDHYSRKTITFQTILVIFPLKKTSHKGENQQ